MGGIQHIYYLTCHAVDIFVVITLQQAVAHLRFSLDVQNRVAFNYLILIVHRPCLLMELRACHCICLGSCAEPSG
jgi:hypothetical protein